MDDYTKSKIVKLREDYKNLFEKNVQEPSLLLEMFKVALKNTVHINPLTISNLIANTPDYLCISYRQIYNSIYEELARRSQDWEYIKQTTRRCLIFIDQELIYPA